MTWRMSRRAYRDLIAIEVWYAGETTPGLDADFASEFIATADELATRPTSYPIVEGDVRMTRMRRFPYRVYFRTDGTILEIQAIYHRSRDPERWDDPMRE